MNKYSVFGYYRESGQTFVDHVVAPNTSKAFFESAKLRQSGVEYLVAIPSHLTEDRHGIGFPGEGVVDAETILDQESVFDNPSFDEPVLDLDSVPVTYVPVDSVSPKTLSIKRESASDIIAHSLALFGEYPLPEIEGSLTGKRRADMLRAYAEAEESVKISGALDHFKSSK